jgi:hypothetical protein
MQTNLHASTRSQQRGIPPLIDQLLDLYGHEEYDGHGGVLVYFDKRSRRHLEHDMGREPVRRISEWLNAYKIRSSIDGSTITLGHRFRRIRRK